MFAHASRRGLDHAGANARPIREVWLRSQKLTTRQDRCNRGTKFVANIGGELLFTPQHARNAVLIVIECMSQLRHFLILPRLYHCCTLNVTGREMSYSLRKVSDLLDEQTRNQITHHECDPDHGEEG